MQAHGALPTNRINDHIAWNQKFGGEGSMMKQMRDLNQMFIPQAQAGLTSNYYAHVPSLARDTKAFSAINKDKK